MISSLRYLLLWMFFCCYELDAQFLLTSPNYTYTQDFGTSTITNSGTNIVSGTANLTGWSYDGIYGGELNITAAAPTNAGGRYAYTLNGNSNRKIGARPSGGTGIGDVAYGILFRNTSGQTIQSFSVSYTGYQLSLGGNTNSNINQIRFDYIVSASTIAMTAAAGTAVPALDFSQTQFVSTANTSGQGAGYPNTVGSGVNSGCVSVSASIPNNSYLLLRWSDDDDSQNDPHLAIDNVQVIFFTNQTVTNNSACSFLPVDLLDFYALKTISGNDITWKVANEDHISGYALEKSLDGIAFSELGTINPSDASAAIKTYDFTDIAFTEKIAYYRLSTIEKSGLRKFYKIISVENELSDWQANAYQSGTDLMVEFKHGFPENAEASIYDLSGQLLAKSTIHEKSSSISTGNFSSGVYLVKISTPYKSQNFKTIISNNTN